jgi:sRNA-binding carbon storage regulator CsrA
MLTLTKPQMQHFGQTVAGQGGAGVLPLKTRRLLMLRLSVNKNEYLMVGNDVKITFLGGNNSTLKLMIEAPKEVNIARGKAIEKRAKEREIVFKP